MITHHGQCVARLVAEPDISRQREVEAPDATLAERDRRLRALFEKWEQEPPAGTWGDDDMHDEHGIPR